MPIHINIEQNTPEWMELRSGVATASEFSKIITPGQGKPSTQATAYRRQLIAEKLGYSGDDGKNSHWMDRGHALEDDARQAYSFITGQAVAGVGFVFLDETRRVGASPDGLVGDSGGIEIKCPAPHTHIGYLLDRKAPKNYWAQIQGGMWVCDRQWWDFMSYCPGLPPLIVRVTRDNEFIDQIAILMGKFLKKMDEELERL